MTDSPDATSLVAQLVEGLEPGSLVTRFVVVAEVISPDGMRAIWVHTDEDAQTWDAIGLLDFALTKQRAAVARDLGDEDDEN